MNLQKRLLIDPDFRDLIRPLSQEERTLLETNIKANGCLNPILIWKQYIIDGHNRYEICSRNAIPFSVMEMEFSSKEEAIIWICNNQLGRRNLTDEAKKYLIGKRYEAEKMMASQRNLRGTNQYSQHDFPVTDCQPKAKVHEKKKDTAQKIGNEYRISKSAVQKYGAYSKAVDHLDDVDPGIRQLLLSGRCKVSHKNIVEMSKMEDDDFLEVSRKLRQPRKTFVPYSTSRQHVQEENAKNESALNIGIKQLPPHDPDSEIKSLALTIPSWISSIARIRNYSELCDISAEAKGYLEEALIKLRLSVEELLEDVEKK